VQVAYRSKEEIELIRISSLLVGDTIAETAKHIRAGITTEALDKIAEEYIHSFDAKPAFKGYNGFPASLCISVNAEVVHGIPRKRELVDGDLVSIDCGVVKNEFYGDSAYSFAVSYADEKMQKLMRVTKECLYIGIAKAVVGNRVGDISYNVQRHAEMNGYGVVRELVGHGVGRKLHEKPEVPNFGKAGQGMLLKPGIVIAIEPMINMGVKNVRHLKDGWTVVTADNLPSAHYEHTVAVDNIKAEILSSFIAIEKAELENKNLGRVEYERVVETESKQ
jgi:methionyl aminopeptidase